MGGILTVRRMIFVTKERLKLLYAQICYITHVFKLVKYGVVTIIPKMFMYPLQKQEYKRIRT